MPLTIDDVPEEQQGVYVYWEDGYECYQHNSWDELNSNRAKLYINSRGQETLLVNIEEVCRVAMGSTVGMHYMRWKEYNKWQS